jgi:hypothetical protein
LFALDGYGGSCKRGGERWLISTFSFVMLMSFAEQHGRMEWPGKGRNQKKLVKKVIKKAKKEENTEVDRSDVKPPSPFSSQLTCHLVNQ